MDKRKPMIYFQTKSDLLDTFLLSLCKWSLWPKCPSGQIVPAKVSLAKVLFWPKCNSASNIYGALKFSIQVKIAIVNINRQRKLCDDFTN